MVFLNSKRPSCQRELLYTHLIHQATIPVPTISAFHSMHVVHNSPHFWCDSTSRTLMIFFSVTHVCCTKVQLFPIFYFRIPWFYASAWIAFFNNSWICCFVHNHSVIGKKSCISLVATSIDNGILLLVLTKVSSSVHKHRGGSKMQHFCLA